MNSSPIGVFDSGVGGLSLLCELRRLLPNEDFIYYGDRANAPYGAKTHAEILNISKGIFDDLISRGCKAIVVACNTATAVCAEKLREKYSFPIIGLEPAILPAMRSGGEIFVLATRATCNSSKFQALCERAKGLYSNAKLRVFPCDGLAGAIEKNLANPNADYSEFLPGGKPTLVVLGCTHYIYIRKQIEEFFACPTLDANQSVARRLFDVLSRRERWSRVVENIPNENDEKITQNLKEISEKKQGDDLELKNIQEKIFLRQKNGVFNAENREEKPLFLKFYPQA
jgi:glutamate racemase